MVNARYKSKDKEDEDENSEVIELDVEMESDLAEGKTSDVTVTAKDQQDNLVSGLELKYESSVTDEDDTTSETYQVNEEEMGDDFVSIGETDNNGTVTFEVEIPDTVDEGDGFELTLKPRIDESRTVGEETVSYYKN